MDCDGAMQSLHFHTQVAHMDGCIEFVFKPSAEDGIVWVVEVYYVEGHVFCPGIFLAFERN